MMVIITRIIGVLLMVSLLASCNDNKKETDKNTSEIDYQRIEMITNRKVIFIDSTQLDSSDREDLSFILRIEKDKFTKGMKLALDYDIEGGYEIIHLYHKTSPDCRYTCCRNRGCPIIYAQLTCEEFKKLMNRFKGSRGKHEDDVKDYQCRTFHRTFIYTPNGITVFLEGHESCCEETVSLQLDAMTKVITYHYHHHYWCQTGSSCHTAYERLWEELQNNQNDGIKKKG